MQNAFAEALFDCEKPIPEGLISHNSSRPTKRFAVYRNNVIVSLVEALRAKFPATERIVGEEFFRAMARTFVVSQPPRSKILHAYGEAFGDFIEAFEPAAELPYLADVARLEAARTRAYHAADAVPLDANAFAGIAPDRVAGLRLTLHPSLEIVRSLYPMVTIWSMNAGETELAPIDEQAAEDAVVLRPHLEVFVQRLPPGGAAFVHALRQGSKLQDAMERALAEDARFELSENLGTLIGSGAVTAIASQGA